ncbi:MAG: peptide chain release factor 2 [Candidatus Omnitrophota bacterium]
MMLEELRDKLEEAGFALANLRRYLDLDNAEAKIKEFEAQMSVSGFWDDSQKAQDVIRQLKEFKSRLDPWQEASKEQAELMGLIGIVEPADESSILHVKEELDSLLKKISQIEFKALFSGEHDSANAILSINAGAGGTESCDWASMLFRMYVRYAQRRGYKVDVIDYLAGEEAGVKNVTIMVEGEYAFGYLRSEIGVHRLVRISPFDSNKRRHTSFASVDVIPELEADAEIDIDEKDLRIDVYRASGPGGQGVNTTDSAVRITHMPTGLVVQCQNERSQLKNKHTAMKVLKSRLYEKRLEEQQEKLKSVYSEKQKIEWGSQIRSYVMHPYNMVKDHRTEYETGKVNQVMDGELDELVEAYVRFMAAKR